MIYKIMRVDYNPETNTRIHRCVDEQPSSVLAEQSMAAQKKQNPQCEFFIEQRGI